MTDKTIHPVALFFILLSINLGISIPAVILSSFATKIWNNPDILLMLLFFGYVVLLITVLIIIGQLSILHKQLIVMELSAAKYHSGFNPVYPVRSGKCDE